MNLEQREQFAQLLDRVASDLMPGENEPADGSHPAESPELMQRVQLAMQLNQYGFRVRNGDVDPDLVSQIALGLVPVKVGAR